MPVWKVLRCCMVFLHESFHQHSNPMLSLNWCPTCWRRVVEQSKADSFCLDMVTLSSVYHWAYPQGTEHRRLLDSHQVLYSCYRLHSHISPNETSPSEMRWAKWKTHSMAKCQEKMRAFQRWNTSQTAMCWLPEFVNLSSSHSVLVCPERSASLVVSEANQNVWSYNVTSDDQDTYTNRRQKSYSSPV